LVDRLSNGDMTKDKDIYKINYMDSLNRLSYWYFRDKQTKEYDNALELRQKNKRK